MAGVLKVADAGGADRAVTAISVIDAGGANRVLQSIRVIDASGTDRVVFQVNSGPAPSGATIAPPYRTFAGKGYTRSATFTASSTDGELTSFTWGVLDGSGTVAANGSTATATLSVFADPGETQTTTFFCDMAVGGATQRATCMLTYTNGSGNSGQPLQ